GGRGRVGIVAVQLAEPDVLDVDVLAGRDVPGREPDDLPVLEDRLTFLDRHDRELVTQLHRRGDGDRPAVDRDLGPGRDGPGGDGDIVIRPEGGGGGLRRRGRDGKPSRESSVLSQYMK